MRGMVGSAAPTCLILLVFLAALFAFALAFSASALALPAAVPVALPSASPIPSPAPSVPDVGPDAPGIITPDRPGISDSPAVRQSTITTLFRALVEYGYTPGIVIGITDGKNTQVFGMGEFASQRVAAPGELVFEIGSVTKTFTALLLADASLRGEVALDDPVQKYLPSGVQLKSRERPILMHHLATHTSDLPRMPSNWAPRNLWDPYVDYTDERLWDFLKSWNPLKPPDRIYSYSNLGSGLLGELLSRALDRPYEQLIRDRICVPLGMTSTAVSPTAAMKLRQVTGHEGGGDVVPGWHFDALAGCGALHSTVDDLLGYVNAQIAPADDSLGRAIELTHPRRFKINEMLSIALGWHRLGPENDFIFFHDGGTYGCTSFVTFDPKTGVGLVALANAGITGYLPFPATQACNYLRGRQYALPDLPKAIELPAGVLQRYVGKYQFLDDGSYLSVISDGRTLKTGVEGSRECFLRIFPFSTTRFFYMNTIAAIDFEFDENTRAVISLTLRTEDQKLKALKIE